MCTISTTNWNFPHYSPCETGGRKARGISICCRNCSQGNCSYFDFPLNKKSWSFPLERLTRGAQKCSSFTHETPDCFCKGSTISFEIVQSSFECAYIFIRRFHQNVKKFHTNFKQSYYPNFKLMDIILKSRFVRLVRLHE